MIRFFEIMFDFIGQVIGEVLKVPVSYNFQEQINNNVWVGMKFGDVLIIIVFIGLALRFMLNMKG